MMTLKLYKDFPINDYADQVAYLKSNGTIDTDKRDKAFDDYATKDSTFTNLSSCDKTRQTIRLNINYYVGNQYNYGCIIEDDHRYYVFLDVVEWVSNRTVVLHYTYDYWQTYGHRIKLKKSFIEREHVSDDTFGKHIIDEGLPIDEYVVNSNDMINNNNDGVYYCICCTDSSDVISTAHSSQVPVSSMCKPSKYEQSPMIYFTDDIDVASNYLKQMINENKLEGIQGFYYVPKVAIPSSIQHQGYNWDTGDDDIKYVGDNNSLATMFNWELNRPTAINGYSNIKNNKCFTYPYCFCNITNNNGNNLIGQFELSNNKSKVSFDYYFPMTEGSVSFGYLKNYDGVGKNFDKSIQGQTNVELPWVSNTYSAYMSANQNAIANQKNIIENNRTLYRFGKIINIPNDVISSITGVIGSIGTGVSGNINGAVQGVTNVGGNVINSALNRFQTEMNFQNQLDTIQASLDDVASKADVAHGVFTGNGCSINGQIGFKGQLITVTAENIKMIDNYFTMFGYRVNRIGVPQYNSRPHWNFVKTSGLNVVGNVPQDALNVIKKMFDSGTTLWHNIKNMYDYDLDNRA